MSYELYERHKDKLDFVPPEERTFGGTLKDVGISLGKGVVGTGQAAIGLADIVTPGQLGKAIEENVVDFNKAQEYLSEQYTPAQKAANARVESAQGFLSTLGAMVQNPSTIGHAIVESAPSMYAGGLIGKGLGAAKLVTNPMLAGAIGEGTVTAGQVAENIRQQTPDKTLSLGQAGAALGAGIGTSALGAIGGKIASKLGISDIDTYLAGGQLAEKSNKGVIRRIVEGGISEGVFEELPQSMQEQVWMNAATGKPLGEGVKEAGAAGLLTGATMGGGVNVFTSGKVEPDTKSNLTSEEQQLVDINKQISDKVNNVKPEEMTPEFFTELRTLEEQQTNLKKKPIGNIQTEVQLPTDPDELNRQIMNLEAVSNPNPGTTELLQQLYQQKENILQSPELEATRRIQSKTIEQRNYEKAQEDLRQEKQRQYENIFDLADAVDTLGQVPVGLRQTDIITRQGKPYQRKDYLENYLQDNVNKDDYEIVEVQTKSFLEQRQNELRAKLNGNISQQERLNILQELSDNQFNIDEAKPNDVGYVARLTDNAIDRGKTLWEDGKNIYSSEDAYWDVQTEAIKRQQETPLQTVTDRRIPFEEILPRSNQQVIDNTYNEQERTVAELPNVGSTSEQTVQQPATEEVTTSVKEATNLERKTTLQDEISARESEVSDLTNELEANRIEQSKLGVDDPILADLKLDEENLNKSIQQKNTVLGLLQNRLDQGKYEIRQNQEPGQGIDLPTIQSMYKDQEVFQSPNGSISVKLKNGKGITFNSIQDAGNGFIQYAIQTGQMDKDGKILGITQNNNVLLDKDFADKKTAWHESGHVWENLGMIQENDISALNKEFNKLRNAGKLEFDLSTHEDPKIAMQENRMNTFAQVMVNREQYRNTTLGKMIQRIMDFVDKMFSFGQQSIRGLAKEVESGKFYERQGIEQTNNTSQFDIINPTDINTQSFKDWFGNSKVVNNEDKPLVVYQGRSTKGLNVLQNPKGDVWATNVKKSAENFADIQERYYPNRPKEHQIEREMRGEIYPLYMNLQNPKTISHKITLWNPTKEAEQISLAKQEGYDGLIIQHDNGKKDFVAFNPNQVKSIFNHGTWDKKYPNINFEVRQKFNIPEQEIPQAEYDRMRVENRNIVGKVKQFMRSKGHEINRTMNKYLGMTSTNLLKIHPMLQAKVRRLDFDTLQRVHTNLKDSLPVLEAVNKMSKNDKSDWDWAVKNSDAGKILSLANKYNFTEQYQTLRESLDQIHKDLVDVGYKPGFVDTYWPRLLKDREGFLQATREISRDPVFTQALQEKANKLGKSIDNLDSDVRAEIIGQKIMEIKSGIGGPANIQGRVYDKIPPDLGKYYMDSSASLVQYIYSTAKNIEARKFFGKVPDKISNAKQIVRRGYNKLAELNNTLDLLSSQDRDISDIRSKIKEVQDNIKLSEELIENYGQTRDFTENIGSYIDELRTNKLVQQDDEATLKDILSARFHERGTSGIANIYKNLSLLDTMGSPISALTQIQDLGWSIYVGGLTPRGITNTVKNIAKAIGKRSDITKENLGIEWIAQEFADADTFSNAVNKVFKITGLNYMDSIGKESLINNAYDNYKVKAKDRPKLFKEIRHMFSSDNETNQVITDLENDNRDSKNVQFLVFSRLLDFQPASKSEMPEKMLTAGNWRLAYLLKTFTLKQFDIFRRDVWHKLKSGEASQIKEGLQNMAMLTSLMTLTGAGADELKDYLLGKEAKFSDHMIENFLTLAGANRYIRMEINREGIGTALGKQILPPFKFVDSIYKDVANNVTDLHSARFVDSIPVGGKLYYWHLGKGTEMKQSIAEQDFKKEGKDVRKFKERLDNATDKRSFIRSNLSEFQTVRRYENMQGNLNKLSSLINKLKKIPQTENIKRRINQLESRKEQLYQRYGSYSN